MREVKTSKGTWKIHGVDIIPSDSIYIDVKKCIEEGTLSPTHLQTITGHRSPIEVNFSERSITFSRF